MSNRDHFITDIIDADVEAGAVREVVTRFPPEPNGFLHIGHAKSICLNFGLAERYGGKCYLRFDDTNPLTEDTLYVESIERDVRWLGFTPAEDAPRFASDYFEAMYGFAEELIEKGLAFVCSQNAEELRRDRGSITEPGVPSPDRARPVAENLDLFRRMRAGEFPDGAYTLRAKIDMASPNFLMRDPALYRIRHARHHRQGDAWCIYPMYDFAHCLEDAVEGISHSICTLEFETNRELYDWVLDNVTPPSRPRQYEFARLNLDYTVMSKRKFLVLVDEGLVDGWDDPRMPTLAGLRRRGFTPESLRAFCAMVGVAKANSVVDMGKLEYCIRDDLNGRAPRLLGVLRPLRATLQGWSAQTVDAPLWPREIGREGSRPLEIPTDILVERDDWSEDPPPGWKRMAPGRPIRLRHGPVVRCEGVEGDVLRLTVVPEAEVAKGVGVVHWVAADTSIPVQARLYDRLLRVPLPGDDFVADLNPHSLVICDEARIEPFAPLPERFQLERQGFFHLDRDSTPERPVLNRTVTLKDTWARSPEAAQIKRKVRVSGAGPTKTLDSAGRYYVDAHGVSEEQALVLAGDPDLGALFEEVVEGGVDTPLVATAVAGEVRRHVKEAGSVARLRYGVAELIDVLGRLGGGELTRVQAVESLDSLASTGELPVFEAGGDLDHALAGILEAHPDELERYRGGERKLLGFFMGEAMRATRGAFDPGDVRTAIQAKLSG